MPTLADLAHKRMILVVGKGGVGRTTVAAALSTLIAGQGRRTLLYQASAKDKLAGLLGGPRAGESIVRMRDNLWAVNTNPQAALHEYGLMILRYETIYKMVLENRFAKALVRAIPGVDDFALLGKAWWHTTEMDGPRARWDTLVFDAPATGHALSMLKIPRAILDAVPEGPLTREARKVQSLLEDPARTALVIVTLAEEMPVNESIDLAARLKKDLRLEPSVLVVNQLYPDRFPRGGGAARVLDAALAAAAAASPALAPSLERARLARGRRELNERYLARLAQELPAPMVQLPTLFVPALGPGEVAELAARLAEQLSATQGAAA